MTKTHLPADEVLTTVFRAKGFALHYMNIEQRMLPDTLNVWVWLKSPIGPKGAMYRSAASCSFTIVPGFTMVLMLKHNWKNFIEQLWMISP